MNLFNFFTAPQLFADSLPLLYIQHPPHSTSPHRHCSFLRKRPLIPSLSLSPEDKSDDEQLAELARADRPGPSLIGEWHRTDP